MQTFDVAIIGAGTAGLTARREVARHTDNYVLIEHGPMGTTCARVGCMPSKVLIQVANDFDRRLKLDQQGIAGGQGLSVDTARVMKHVRSLRDRFVRGVTSSQSDWEDHLLRGRAAFVDPHTLSVNGNLIRANKIIVATGSRPLILKDWLPYREQLLTTDELFELDHLPATMAVFGLGVIGVELGQALHKLGVRVVACTTNHRIGGITDPDLQKYVAHKLGQEMNIHFSAAKSLGLNAKGQVRLEVEDKEYVVDKILFAVGRIPNIDLLKIENTGVTLDERGLPQVDKNTMSLIEATHIFLPGDVNSDRPILHEAADEGVIAGHNAISKEETCFQRRVPLGIVFCEPNIASVGASYIQLKQDQEDFVVGEVSFEGQGRSIVKLKEQGLLHVYVRKSDGKILGAELQAPDGEHLAHLLAWAISLGLTVKEALRLPFYHPVVEEGLRTALRDASKKIDGEGTKELFRCSDPPIR
jgi:dihydrolipoamide dehydrogenase